MPQDCIRHPGGIRREVVIVCNNMHAVTEQPLDCPFCGEVISVLVDASAGEQQYVEDCQVCCRPMLVTVSIAANGDVQVAARYENE